MPSKTRLRAQKEAQAALMRDENQEPLTLEDSEVESNNGSQDEADVTVRPSSVVSRRSVLTRREDEEFEFLEEQIYLLKDQLSDLKAERNLELLQEEERKSELEQEKAKLFEERHKCAFGDPNLPEIDKKIDSINGTLEVIRSTSSRKGIEYERRYEKGTTRLERLERKLQREIASDASSRRSSSIASIPQDNRIDVIERWNARQAEARKKSEDDIRNLEVARKLVEQQVRDKQEEQDRLVAEALQADIDKADQEIEKLRKMRDEKKQQLVIPSKLNPQGKEVKPFVPTCSTPLDKDQILAAMFARQSSSKDLPHFNGSPEQWVRFKNEFYRTTERCSFSMDENLSRLEKSLKGEALTAVKSLLAFPTNVPVIMKRLEDIFGDPDVIIRNLLTEVRQTPPVKEGRPEGFVEFGNVVMNLTATLESLEKKEHLCNPMLVQELQDKLPYETKLRWIKYSVSNGKNLVTFSQWLDEEVRYARKLCVHKFETGTEDKKDRESRQKSGKSTGRCLTATDEKLFVKKGHSESRPCFICGKDGHFAGKCKTLLDKSPEERFKFAMEKKLCTSCLIPGHRFNECRKKRICGVRDCMKEHHPALHKDHVEASTIPETEPEKEETINSITTNGDTLMGALPVILSGPAGDVKCLAFIDSGSTVTLLKEEIAHQLGVTGPVEPFCLKAFNSDKSYKNSKVLSLGIRGVGKKSKNFNINGVRTIDDLPIGKMSQDAGSLKKRYPEFQSLPIPSFENAEPDILIGMRELHIFAPFKIVGRSIDAPTAMQCHLGWRVGGPNDAGKARSSVSAYHSCNVISVEETLSDLEERSCTTEDFGVRAAPTLVSSETGKAMKVMEEATAGVPGKERSQTGLLWRDETVKPPENKNAALHRLHWQERNMNRKPEFADVYCKEIQEYVDKDFRQKLSVKEAAVKTDRMCHLPHFGIWTPSKRTLVYDVAAKSQGVSLNDVLMSGPDLHNSLVSVLWKFRQYEYAFAGDLKDMFHRVDVGEDDRDSERFLWRGTRRDTSPEENADGIAKEFLEACAVIKINEYADDLLKSDPERDKPKMTMEDIVLLKSEGGLDLRNWQPNRPKLLERLADELKCSSVKVNSECCVEEYSVGELKKSELALVKLCQEESFPEELRAFNGGKEVDKSSEILSLEPFMDPCGILRVKGRLGWCGADKDFCHPTILDGSHHVTKMKVYPEEMTGRLTMKEMQCIFYPPAAPHMGGSLERLVGSVKRTIKGIMASRHPNDETIKVVDCRPLIEVPVDPSDPDPLTPNHFLVGWQGGTKNEDLRKPVWGEFQDSDLYLRKTWRTAQRLADQIWNRWLKDYLPTLTRRPKWMKTKDPVELDDVVLMVDDTGPRHSWPLGRITALYPGKDGEIRMVDVKTTTGIYKRPTCKIVKLQVRRDEVPPSGGRMWKGREGLDSAAKQLWIKKISNEYVK